MHIILLLTWASSRLLFNITKNAQKCIKLLPYQEQVNIKLGFPEPKSGVNYQLMLKMKGLIVGSKVYEGGEQGEYFELPRKKIS